MIGTSVLFGLEYADGMVQLQQDTIARARAMTQAVDGQLFIARATAQTLAASRVLLRGDFKEFHQLARDVLASTGVGMNVVVSDPSGQQILNTLRELGAPLPQHGNPEVLRQVLITARPVVSGLYVGGALHKPVISVDVPVLVGGKVAYVLSVGMLPGDLNSILVAQHFSTDLVAAVFDPEGTIVARTHSPEKFVGQKGTAEYIQQIRQTPEGGMRTITREGIPTLSVWSRSAETGWSVGIGIPSASLEHALMLRLAWLGFGMTALLAIGLGLAWFVARKIAVSVRGLTAPALAMREGDLAPMPHLEIEESAEVAQAISETAQLLAARAAEITAIQRAAGFGVWRHDLRTKELVVSDSIHEMFGQEVPSFPSQRGTLFSVPCWEQLKAAGEEAARSGEAYDLELQVNHANGSIVWVNLKGKPLFDAAGRVCELRGSILDITKRKQAELALDQSRQSHMRQLEQEVAARTASLKAANQELERLSRTDVLTGLQNRYAANDRLRQEFLRQKRTGSIYAVLFIDIDHFKKINDSYGHETGDQVLRRLAEVLRGTVRATDFAARYGGEEFVVVLPDTDVAGAQVIAEKVRSAIAESVSITGAPVTVSIGTSAIRAEDKNEEEAVIRADEALYQAKEEGRNRVAWR
ncbi:diguanylate cyclase [Paucibacter sediminis]|uniref:diguanylate cyclase n=1 Tax=Paucibacter sediminis TaxID=3019553 RepID=A0AA95SNA3_9BURK|nr:diguanylate cyclase [Paucibacter sp. S2-9]WIT14153.1 diguanylate cyclase [Paucibacter sp. S2-9]